MDTQSIIDFIVIFILLLLSAFFSSAETALTTVSHIKVRSLIEEGNKRATIVDKVISKKSKMLSAILIGNNIVNITTTAIATAVGIRIWGSVATGIVTGVLSIVVIIFGEIIPKSAAAAHAISFSLVYAPIIRIIMILLTPVIYIVDAFSNFILNVLRINPNGSGNKMTEAELKTIVNVGHEYGIIETSEKAIINNLFEFGDTPVKEVMTQRIDMTMLDITTNIHDMLKIFRETMYTRIPVYENDPDNIIGILNIKDLITKDNINKVNVRDILRKPFYTFEHKLASELFREMKLNSRSIAIVLDEYNSVAGMVTTEDLLEEIVGEIRDEYDSDEHDAIIKINATTYRADGSCNLDDINETLLTNLESEDNDSIGGLITEKLDRIPKTGDSLVINNVWIKVTKAKANRVDSVVLRLINNNE